MNRISTNLPNDNMQFHLRERTRTLSELQNSISAQTRILNLRDDPMAAAHATRYRSYQVRLERFSDNIQTIQQRHHVAEGHMQQAVSMLQRARELAVQGAHGTFAPDDLQHMATEIEEILKQMVEVANARGADGTMVFAGDRTTQIPFRETFGIRGADNREVITNVHYTGTINPQYAEIGESSYVQTNFPGNQVFWAEQQQLYSRTDARAYQVGEDTSILVDGVQIDIRAGDTVHAIIQRINESSAAVRARLDPVHSSVVIETTTPHQLWLQDAPGGTVLQDLGLIRGDGQQPPQNIAREARVAGGSVFDALITLRDQLRAGDQASIGSSGLVARDAARNNVLSHMGRLGAVSARLDGAFRRTETEIPLVMQQHSRITDVDFAQAITDLKQLEYTHRAALGVAARVVQPTLLDFLR